MIDWISDIIKYGITNDKERELLGQSLFYYCSGKDPSPIIAFGSEYPLYIYSDIDSDFRGMTSSLCQRLQKAGFILTDDRIIQGGRRWKNSSNIDLMLWKTPTGRETCVLYLQYDAVHSFKNIYSDHSNYIQPKCICNYRYEFTDPSRGEFFCTIEKRTEYIFGHCSSDKYRIVCEYDYHGDYETGTKIKLHHRMFWYVY